MNNIKCCACDNNLIKDTHYTFRCKNCDLYISNLVPGFGREIAGIDDLRIKNSKVVLSKILPYKSKSDFKILEFGSGEGLFINEAQKLNLDITGSEPDEPQYQNLKKRYKNIIKVALPFNEVKEDLLGKYDFIVFNDVFEHLKELDKILIQLKSYLKDDGYLVINIPSSDGFIFKISKLLYKINIKSIHDRLWQKSLNSPHLTYFNNKNLPMFLKKFNYDLVYSGSLDFVGDKGNFERLYSINKNKLYCYFYSTLLKVLYYVQKLLPRDCMFHIYKKY